MRRIVVLASLSLLVLTAVPAEAAVVSVGAGGSNTFDPEVTTLTAPGQAVTWDWAADVEDSHNVHQDAGLFSSPFASIPDAEFERMFSAGNFHYYCQLHGATTGGMDGRVRVPVLITAAPTGRPFTVRWATAATNVGQVFDVQYRIGGGAWVTWRTDATARYKVFGADGKPVVVKAGRTYSFRARTQASASAPLRRSGWSPVRSFQA
jgi:plastocyanin